MKGDKAESQREKGQEMMSGGNQAHILKSPVPAESRRTCLVPPATGCSLETQPLRFLYGPGYVGTLRYQNTDAQRKADVQHKPHCLHN